jgi:hypothetical protein
VRNIVLVGSGDSGPSFHRQGLWAEGEIIDRDGIRISLRRILCPAGQHDRGEHRRGRAPSPAAMSALRIVFDMDMANPSGLKRRVNDGKALLVLLERDVGDAEHAAQLVGRDVLYRPWRRSGARRRLRERRRAGGMERDVAFHLLHNLVDMAVEDGH